MCGRFTQQRPTADLAALFEAEPLVDDPGGHFNLAPTDAAAVVVEQGDRRAITSFAWGLIPHWETDPRRAAGRINARAETVATSAAFRESFRRRRCIVPADGFYEWQRDGSARRAFYIHRRDGAPLALAGLWSGWRDPATDTVRRTFTIVTTNPNDAIAGLHDRMPAILEPVDWALWLDPALQDVGELHGLLGPSPSEPLEIVAVAQLVNNVRNNGPELIRPLAS
ncbi:MAG: SOS response-associated peptidase [Chloroflexota bacterium]